MFKKITTMIIVLCALFTANVFAQSYIFTSTFEDDTVGSLPHGWRSIYPFTEKVYVSVTEDEDKISPFADIFPRGKQSLLFVDEDSSKSEPGASVKTNSTIIVKDIKTNPNADFLLSLDFKILHGGNMSIFLFSPDNQYLTRVRIIENRPIEIRAAGGGFDKANLIIKRGQWYRLQLIVHRAEGTMDVVWLTEDGKSGTFKDSELFNPLPGQQIQKIWIQSTVGDGSETGSWVIDNVFAQELK